MADEADLNREMDLQRFARPCPNCRGPIFRDLTWWEQVLFFLPVHFVIRAHYQCYRCKERFHSGPGAVDGVLSVLFIGAHFFLSRHLWITAIFLVVWLLFTLWHGYGPIHLFIATQMLAVLWFFALLVNANRVVVSLPVMGGGGFLLGYLLLFLDKTCGGKLRRP